MSAVDVLRALLAIAIGLLLGSVLPADLLARRRGVDIRTVGDGNPGTINAIRSLGWGPGLIAGAYDISIGVVAILLARVLGVSAGLGYVAGLMTIVGHRFPVFRGFVGGGQGMATSAGMLLYGIGVALSSGWLNAADIAGLIAVLLITFVVTRSDRWMAVVMLPILLIRLFVAHPGWQFLAFMAVVAANIWVVQVIEMRHRASLRAVRPVGGQTRD